MTNAVTGSVRCDAIVDGLFAEFGGLLAQRILEAEAADFLWESRIAERYLGQQMSDDAIAGDTSYELSRILVLSKLAGDWQVGICLVDADKSVVDLLWKRRFEDRLQAETAFLSTR